MNQLAEAAKEEVKVEAAPLLSLWRNRDYMLLWSGQVVSTLGSGWGLAVLLNPSVREARPLDQVVEVG